jgi:phage tail sheath protein FI
LLGFTDGTTLLTPAVPADVVAAYASATTAKQRGAVAIGPVLSAVNEAIAFFHSLESTQNNYEKTLNDSLLAAFGAYKDLVTKAADALNLLPPSGAVAGVYAATDRDRGVWKAPANVSLNAVIGPAVKITHDQQAEFNVDVNAGKSINIIRAFTGKGTLVWGARTLAGNDSEWRYVNVRRFFNFVEESVKKATEQFVFESNDANTWVRIQAMIENFLTFLWRQGALQGIKPEHAFYVAVGLGKTMTAVDILEGRLIVEIGLAAVRPAEFIILKFSHKMAES